MLHSKHIFISSVATVTLVLCSSIVNAETVKSGRHSLIHRPTFQPRPPVTLDSADRHSRPDKNVVLPATPPSSFRHKLVKRPTVPHVTATQPNDRLPSNASQLGDASTSAKP